MDYLPKARKKIHSQINFHLQISSDKDLHHIDIGWIVLHHWQAHRMWTPHILFAVFVYL